MIEINAVQFNKKCILLRDDNPGRPTDGNCFNCELWRICHDIYHSDSMHVAASSEPDKEFLYHRERNESLRKQLIDNITNSHYGACMNARKLNIQKKFLTEDAYKKAISELCRQANAKISDIRRRYSEFPHHVDDIDRSSMYDSCMRTFELRNDSIERYKELVRDCIAEGGKSTFIPDDKPDLQLKKIRASSIYGQFGNVDSNRKKKKLFISQPFTGLSEELVFIERGRAIKKLDGANCILTGGVREKIDISEWEVIDQYHVENPPEDASRLWYLGNSIRMMSEADLIYFINGWDTAKGCIIEFNIARMYHLPHVIEN